MKRIEAALGLIELRSQHVSFTNDRYPVRGKAAIVERDELGALVVPQAVKCHIARDLEQPRLELRLGTPACTPDRLAPAKTPNSICGRSLVKLLRIEIRPPGDFSSHAGGGWDGLSDLHGCVRCGL